VIRRRLAPCLYADAEGGLHFKGKDPEAERLAARAILAEQRAFRERLHVRHMALLGESVEPSGGTREVTHLVRDESEEELWRAWRAYAV
jgi:hypothetical protein